MIASSGEPVTRLLGQALACEVAEARRLGGQHGADHYRLALADGSRAFAKVATDDAAGFAAEAAGLRWLAAAPGGAGPAVPAVLAVGKSFLVIEWIAEDGPSGHAAARFGADLARLHAAGAEHFGAPWRGDIAGLPLPNDEADDWPQWYANCRLLPYARRATDSGALSAADAGLVESVCARLASLAGPAEPPSRIHGDCWAGNVLWSASRGWLIDPAAHGGHRETDLAMLSLFGAPHLDAILAAYQEVTPLADGWRGRVPLHQLHPLLVHVCLFGASYRRQLLAAAQAALRA
jgi:fructosamine-3-kinase